MFLQFHSNREYACHPSLFQMVDFFDIDRTLVSIATYYQDRFLGTILGEQAQKNRELFRITSVTCLYIAIKLYVPHKWNVTAHSFAQLCRGTISGDIIVDMEMRILFGLGWNVNPPIPLAYVEQFIELIFCSKEKSVQQLRNSSLRCLNQFDDDDSVVGDFIIPSLSEESLQDVTDQEWITSIKDKIIDLARYQLEIALQSVAFLSIRSSVIATAALLNAIEGLMSESTALYPPDTNSMDIFFRDCITTIEEIVTLCNLASENELEEVKTALLSSAWLESANEQSFAKSSLHSVTASPVSTDKFVTLDGTKDHFLSPKRVLSSVYAMNFHGINR